MKLIVKKSHLKGTVAIPASKSHTIRAVAIASLANGTSFIRNPLVSNDTYSSVDCYRLLGAKIDISKDDVWVVDGNGGKISVPDKIIDVGNSGTTLRLASGSAALAPAGKVISLTGDEQIQTRPIAPLLKSLTDLGAQSRSIKNNGKAPVEIGGKLVGEHTTIECFTSQYLSSLLLCTPLAAKDTTIDVTLLNEPDYVKMTCDWLDKQGIKYTNENMRHFTIKGGQAYKPFDMPIPADFSSATFFMCAAAILNGDVTLTGLDFNDSQPDKAVAEYLAAMGTEVKITGSSVHIKGDQLKGIEIDMNKTPDALPAMAVTAAFADGETRLVNVPQARSKETDRIACMAKELKKMGVDIEELPDGLVIHGHGIALGRATQIHAASVHGHGDHRIVMALSLAAMAVDGQTTIDTAEAMRVTFPTFVDLMHSLGADMQLQT
ncbi:MAG: 3-phosphoshikimate 1-carboxyvinyltransferase [Sedimentisphaerales bacterium]|nr:3-phosphoshikimate 1-carboxyvinyltransferase [Sedimentisphaerales bacterium]